MFLLYRQGRYSFDDEVEVFSLPRCWKFEKLGQARLIHHPEQGFVLEGFYRGQPYRIQRLPHQTNSLHVEYNFHRFRKENCFDISTETDSFYCYPTNPDIITKLAFATEEIYKLQQSK